MGSSERGLADFTTLKPVSLGGYDPLGSFVTYQHANLSEEALSAVCDFHFPCVGGRQFFLDSLSCPTTLHLALRQR